MLQTKLFIGIECVSGYFLKYFFIECLVYLLGSNFLFKSEFQESEFRENELFSDVW
jgi:hypothetical protein